MKLSTTSIVFAALFTASPAHGILRATGLGKLSGSTRALQGTPDGDTPATEQICDDFIDADGGAYGLCNSYCEARDCDEVDRPGCDVVKAKFEKVTGENLPCEVQACLGSGEQCGSGISGTCCSGLCLAGPPGPNLGDPLGPGECLEVQACIGVGQPCGSSISGTCCTQLCIDGKCDGFITFP